jgi:twitching motility protein PilJ
MASSSTDYTQVYGQAQKAYMQGNYQEAAAIVDKMVEDYPQDPSVRLLRGHIYCYGLQQYDVAREQYELVLQLTSEADFINYANNGIEEASKFSNGSAHEDFGSSPEDFDGSYQDFGETDDLGEVPTFENWQTLDAGEKESADFDLNTLDFDDTGSDDFPATSDLPFGNPFENSAMDYGVTQETRDTDNDPFATAPEYGDDEFETLETQPSDFDLDAQGFTGLGVDDIPDDFFPEDSQDDTGLTYVMPPADGFEEAASYEDISEPFNPQSEFDADLLDEEIETPPYNDDVMGETYNSTSYPVFEDETYLMGSAEVENTFATDRDDFRYVSGQGAASTEPFAQNNYIQDEQTFEPRYDQNGFNPQEHFDFDTFDEAFGNNAFAMDDVTEAAEASLPGIEARQSTREGFLDEFDVFDDDLGSIPDFSIGSQEDISSESADEPDFDVLSNRGAVPGAIGAMGLSENGDSETSRQAYRSLSGSEEMFSISSSPEQIPVFNPTKETDNEPIVTVEQGFLAPFENAPLKKKHWISAIATGIVSAVVVALVSFLAANTASQDKPEVVSHLRKTSIFMTLAAGLSSFGTTLFLGRITNKQIERASKDLQTQFDAVSQGNLNACATVYSEDEFGQLATGFNQMARVIMTTMSEAQRKAEEQEQAKEDLQRQVIRLLDDVEGAARGDLTVQAEVTADVLGAVADSFNLTIQNLREIVQQVKQAARQVNKGSSDSETFARSLSSDALRQAEELAVTLNSVQVMTDSIQRVAESAREAEEVARKASETALKGGEAVERTVAGILQIRETVAETTRKVKRLAESSQQISTIVALISTIASRTNLLALNASIEAARAGEAGRGFAIVADEVRQLADRAAKALKEIEQIVLQIQSETGQVMTAMEEGTQQVIEGTKRAEQAKLALENIIQVSNRIDALVRSITADTVEQTETSRAVAQVMQSVELTAQETSQEAQRVSGALGNLVVVARDLLTSVERFRVESNDGK